MVKKEHFKYIFALILSGAFMTVINIFADIPKPLWNTIGCIVLDVKYFGALLLAFYVCPYTNTEVKTATFFLALWSIITALLNIMCVKNSWSVCIVCAFSLIWIFWMIRFANLKTIESKEPKENEAYYIVLPIKTIWGLIQAVFLPWHPARYETRMIVDGLFIYSIHRSEFSKRYITETNMNKLKGVKIPLGRQLTQKEKDYFNSLTGKTFIPGYRDCRKFLVEVI